MKYEPIPVSERVLAARELVKTLTVGSETNPYLDSEYRMFCTGDRFITTGLLEGWIKNKYAATTKLRRSLAEAAELDASKPVIYDCDLLCGRLYLPHMSPDEKKQYDELCSAFDNSPFPLHSSGARKDHIALDFEKLLSRGIDDILDELKEKLGVLEGRNEIMDDDFSVLESEEFCKCCIVELEALKRLADRYADYAKELSEQAAGCRREELERMSEAMRRVPSKPAGSFFEAVQSVHFFLSNLFGLYPLGRPDRYLLPYYEQDIEEGIITRKEAQELIDMLCLGISDRVFSRAACGFIVGGQNAKGELVENELTYMFLTALEHIRMSDPNGALSVNSRTSDDILEYAADILGKGVTHPAFFNDETIISSLRRLGVTDEDSVNYIHSTCAEITVVGKSRGHTTAFTVDLPGIVLKIVRDFPETENLDKLLGQFNDELGKRVKDGVRRYEYSILEADRSGNEPMRICCLISDCMERCSGLYKNGARYVFIEPNFAGFATAVDSITAINALCFEEKRLTLSEFYEITANDYNGNEPLRQYIINRIPHYGNDSEQSDIIAGKLAQAIHSSCFCAKSNRKYLVPGTFSYVSHASLGSRSPATFDGRRAKSAYSDGCCPVQGRDVNGPTALINSLTSWDQSDFLAGMVVNVKFAKSSFSEKKRRLLIGIIRAFIEQGGIEIQVNSVDRKELEDAKVHPEDHRDLLVRIGGYSDYFVRLSPALQQEIIERTQY